MKKVLALVMSVMVSASVLAYTPQWLRFVKISPDGKEIAFCYKGDIYKVAVNGGEAVRLTTQPTYETQPVWSPDGKQIAFASDRKGNYDVYVMSSKGGSATRLTTNSAVETPISFSLDGKKVLFYASIQDPAKSAAFPSGRLCELYEVPVAKGAVRQLNSAAIEGISLSPDGSFYLYQDRKGSEDIYRKHHTSSVTRDIWRYDVKTNKYTNLTKHAGECTDPVLSPDGKTVYFLSEREGKTFNVYKFPLANPSQVSQVTSFKTHPVRFLSMGTDGTLCFTYNGEIYTCKDGAQPKKVAIDVTTDDESSIAELSFSRGAGSAVASPNGKEVAFIVRGNVFVTSTAYNTTKQVTSTVCTEEGLTWNKKGDELVYASNRDGNWQLFKASLRKGDQNFANATVIKETPILPSATVSRRHPQFSPDGKTLAFVENGVKIMAMDVASGKVRQVTDGSLWPDGSGMTYSWSPDSKWIAMEICDRGRAPYNDIAIVSAQGGKVYNITNSAYACGDPTWVLDGNAIMFSSERYGMRSHASWGSQDDVLIAFLNRDAYDKFKLSKEDYELLKEAEKQQKKDEKKDDKKGDKKSAGKDEAKKPADGDKKADEKKVKDIVIDFDLITERIVRLTPQSGNLRGAMITNDGETLYYAMDGDLMKLGLRNKEQKRLGKGGGRMQMQADGKAIFISGMQLQKMDLPSEKLTPINFKADMTMDLAEERAYMFQYVHDMERDNFYDKKMHGVDWEGLCANYRKFLPHISNNYDFANLLSELLGELNVSHTGGRYTAPSKATYATASLGLLYDYTYTGKGMRVSEVIATGPMDRASSKVKEGSVIETIDGEAINENNDISSLMAGKRGKKVLVGILNPATGERWEEVVLPISASENNTLLYNRWVKNRAADVERMSGGRLGYVHIASMNDESYRNIYNDVLGKYNDKDGVVIDIRYNGGGRLHEDVEILFSGTKYLTQIKRGRKYCDMPSRRYIKPSIMVTCEMDYSNAHGTPWVYQHMGIGKVVGMPVPGTMTSVNWVRCQDSSMVFGIPVIGYLTAQGNYLENSQLEPDVKVPADPAKLIAGEDEQLRVAVETLLKEIDSKK